MNSFDSAPAVVNEEHYRANIERHHSEQTGLLERAVSLLASKDARWQLTALIVLAIGFLGYEVFQTQKQLISFLHETAVRQEAIIERNTVAFNNVNDSLRDWKRDR